MSASLTIEQAKQGNPKAIEQLLNKALIQREQTATVIGEATAVRILVEGLSVPDEVATFSLIEKGLKNLNLAQAMQIQLYGQRTGSDFPDWIREFHIGDRSDLPNLFSFDTVTVELPPKPNADQPIEEPSAIPNPSLISRTAFQRSPVDRPPCPRNYLVPSILMLIFTLPPLSVVSLIFAAQVDSNYQRGNYEAAVKASERAKIWGIVNVCVAAPIYLFVGLIIMAAVVESGGTLQHSTEKQAIQKLKRLTHYQKSYFFENNRFTSDLAETDLAQSDSYRYSAIVEDDRLVKIIAIPKASGRKSLTAAVMVRSEGGIDQTDFTLDDIICQSQRPTKMPPSTPKVTDTGLTCASGSLKVKE
jgi:hypothetical protein